MSSINDASTGPASLAPQLAAQIDHALRATHTPWLLGVSGVPGSGKSRLASALGQHAQQLGWSLAVVSLDDFYLGRRARRSLAAHVHPLFATRGVPGTHDVALLAGTLQALQDADTVYPLRWPRFDKARDTRAPRARWRRQTHAPHLIILEGWCVGTRPQSAAALVEPVNHLERSEDADGRWRTRVNRALRDYQPLWDSLDALILLQAPRFGVVETWRAQQERGLRQRKGSTTMNATQLKRFVQHFERLSRHALSTLPMQADVRILLDQDREVLATEGALRPSPAGIRAGTPR